jgi:hypothetical protein
MVAFLPPLRAPKTPPQGNERVEGAMKDGRGPVSKGAAALMDEA